MPSRQVTIFRTIYSLPVFVRLNFLRHINQSTSWLYLGAFWQYSLLLINLLYKTVGSEFLINDNIQYKPMTLKSYLLFDLLILQKYVLTENLYFRNPDEHKECPILLCHCLKQILFLYYINIAPLSNGLVLWAVVL